MARYNSNLCLRIFWSACSRVLRWRCLCGWRRGCTRGKGMWSRWSCLKSTVRVGGQCSVPTPTWWIFTRWVLITTAWDHKCCTLRMQRTQRSLSLSYRWVFGSEPAWNHMWELSDIQLFSVPLVLQKEGGGAYPTELVALGREHSRCESQSRTHSHTLWTILNLQCMSLRMCHY